MNTFGHLFRVTTWGESHGKEIGAVLDGVPPNIKIKRKDIQKFLDLRRPGKTKYVTQRKEKDEIRIVSGIFEGKSTGMPISLVIKNNDTKIPTMAANNLALNKKVAGIINCPIDKKLLLKNEIGVTEILSSKCNLKGL